MQRQPLGTSACAPASCSGPTTSSPTPGSATTPTTGRASARSSPSRCGDDQRILGVLKLLSPRPAAFSARDAKALRLLGGLVGASLEHAAAFEARQGRLEDRTRALQESEQRFKQLVDVAQEGIWIADDRGLITYVNQRMADLLGYQNGALLGHPVYDFIDATARAGAQRALGRPAAGGESHDLRFRRKDGTELWGLVSASPITGRDGAVVGHRRHGHRHHRAEAHRGAAPALGRAACRAARPGPGDPGRPLARGDRARGARPDAADGAVPPLHA